MCSSEYDLICEECRRKFDRIFSVKIESAEQERRLLAKWLKSLCEDCRRLLKARAKTDILTFSWCTT